MFKFKPLFNGAKRFYQTPAKPTSFKEIVEHMWNTIHGTIIPELILQDGKIEQIKLQNKWQLTLLALILAALGILLGFCASGKFQV